MDSILEGKTDRCWLECVKRCARTRELEVLFLEVWGKKKKKILKNGSVVAPLICQRLKISCLVGVSMCSLMAHFLTAADFILRSALPNRKHINLCD